MCMMRKGQLKLPDASYMAQVKFIDELLGVAV